MTDPDVTKPAPAPTPRSHRVLRVAESLLLLASLAGIVTFAVSAVSIWRIERIDGAAAAGQVPWGAWYGILIFVASMFLLQVVRFPLRRHARRQARESAIGQRETVRRDGGPAAGPASPSYSGGTAAEAADDDTERA